ncbi:hypothetical protein Ciccas_013071 [Cichlidogyrus casuarinus]|uniref:G-protein coupled receptors family 1 profile domain-containing protein n=1 Tax=Cichlidogyrus casuarinus TaxID=1844966 RepID=A0ABD2PLN4_9PLAT
MALSTVDLLVLILYVFPFWILRGGHIILENTFPNFSSVSTIFSYKFFCKGYGYFAGLLRLLSVWLLVLFTVERYIGEPLSNFQPCPINKSQLAGFLTAVD